MAQLRVPKSILTPATGPRRWMSAALALLLLGCSSVGPRSVLRDRIDYVSAIADSWKRQTLLNIVKLRYGDMPVFLEIGQVIAGYQVQSTIESGLMAGNFASSTVGPFTISGGATASESYTDRPTVIYAPLTGTDFLRKLMTPLPPSGLLFVLQSGYSATMVLPLALDSINGVRNESHRITKREADPRFARLAILLRDLQLAGALQFRIERSAEGAEATLLTFGPSRDPEMAARQREVREILGLRSEVREYRVFYGGHSGKSDEINIKTRSMLQILIELAAIVQVPEQDVASGRAAPGAIDAQTAQPGDAVVTILSGASAPSDAFVSAFYGGRWFWVPDTDIHAKYAFAFVMLLFSVSETGPKVSAPVVTVPAGG